MSRLRWNLENEPSDERYSESYNSRSGRYGGSRNGDSRYSRYNGEQDVNFHSSGKVLHRGDEILHIFTCFTNVWLNIVWTSLFHNNLLIFTMYNKVVY